MRVRVRADYKSRITDGRWHQGITPLEDYFVIGVNLDEYRVVDDKGEPILYPKVLFAVLDARVPPDWQFTEDGDGGFYLDPIRTARPGFYEDFFNSDGNKIAQVETQTILREVLEATKVSVSDEDHPLIERALKRLPRPSKP